MMKHARIRHPRKVVDKLITEQDRSVITPRQDTDFFHTFLEHTPAAVAMFDNEMRYLAYSRRWLIDYGLGDRDIRGLTHYEVFPEIGDEWKNIHQRCLAGATERKEEDPFPRADGTLDWVKWEIVPWRYEDRRIGGIIMFTEVITERKEAAEKVLRSEQFLRLAEKGGNVGSWRWDMVTGENWWSPQSYVIYGVTPKEFDGSRETWISFVHPEDRLRMQSKAEEMFAICKPEFHSEFRIIRSDGSVRWIEARGLVNYDSSGNPIEMIGINIDITERKDIEERLKTAAEMETDARARAQRQSELLQKALLPTLPPAPEGYKVAAQYVPGTPELDIGGDFYDLLITENGRIAILIGDVSGKGVEAVSLASSTRATVRAFAYDMTSPASALTHANAVIYSQEEQRREDMYQFVTVALVVTCPKTGILHYSSAGHPPPLICRANGKVDVLSFGQPPVGIELDMEYSESELRLNPGDKLILYTDGIDEARRGLKFFELAGIRRTLRRYGRDEPAVLVEHLVAEAKSWAGGTLRDDAVVIVVERLRHS